MNRKRTIEDDDDFEEEGDPDEYDDEDDDNDEYQEEDDEEGDFDEDVENDSIEEEEDDEDEDEDEDDVLNEFDEDLVFVIMPFIGQESDEIYAAIRDECSKLGLEAQIASAGIGSGLVFQEIVNWISKAEFIICDLTHERPNVYYELGHAHGLGNDALRILLIAKEGTSIHFDIAPFRVQFYRSAEHLRSILGPNLSQMMQATRS